ncbi:MAG: hypothetical protein ABI614_10115, partial [Planctomycetota bacterium]
STKSMIGTSGTFTIQVEDQAGTPVSTTLNYRLYNANGAVSWEDSTSTDESGVARFDVEAKFARDAARLEVTSSDTSPAPILRQLQAAPEQFVTYLRMDRPLFQPGEPVWYRSVTLSRFGLRAEREVTIAFEIVDADDEQFVGSANTVQTDHGVGSGMFALPSDLPDGKYTLIARSPENLFREEWRDFHVRRFEAPRLLKELELAKDSYTAGDQVELEFSAKRVAGEPLAEVQLQIQATIDGLALTVPEAKTDAEGNSRFSLALPESIDRGAASVSVTVPTGDDSAETITKEIPINLGKVNVDFYPEGGDLAADLPSRVYFYGRDPLGNPTHIEGHVVDSSGREITKVITGHEGRGVFAFTPAFDESYRMIIDKPVGVTKEVPLPAVSPIRFATIETGKGVFAANAPITFTLSKAYPIEPLIVAAYCRGAMVGQQTLDDHAYDTANTKFATFHGEIHLPDEAQGVIRLTVFEADQSPPTPIAERLVYRRIGQKLNVQIKLDAATFSPGQAVELALEIRDENDAPVSAALGIAVVDDAILNLADDKSVRMPTYFHLLTEIDSPEQLEDANFYLSDSPESVAALDALLGTQGWRRFTDLPATQFAQAGAGGFGGLLSSSLGDRRLATRFRTLDRGAEETAVPLSTAATMGVQKIALRQVTRSARTHAPSISSFAAAIVIASIVLFFLVGVTSLRWVESNRSLRVFAGFIAVASLLIGVLSLPMKSTHVAHVTSNAAPATAKTVEGLDSIESESDAYGGGMPRGEADAMYGEDFMFRADEQKHFAEKQLNSAPAAPQPAGQPEPAPTAAAPKTAARSIVPTEQMDREAGAVTSGKAAEVELLQRKKKEAAMPTPNPPPQPISAAEPNGSQPAAGALSGQELMPVDRPELMADKDERSSLSREYARWLYKDRTDNSSTNESSGKSVWIPIHMADDTGKASVFFSLPPHPLSVRAIVEAHGGGRLGAGELIIESR